MITGKALKLRLGHVALTNDPFTGPAVQHDDLGMLRRGFQQVTQRRRIGVKAGGSFCSGTRIFGAQDDLKVGIRTDTVTGVPVYSDVWRTDAKKRPPLDVLKTLDAGSFPDAGARFLHLSCDAGVTLLEAAAANHTEVIVLDPAGPVTHGSICQRQQSQAEFESFTSYHPTPITVRMTLGELAHDVQRGAEDPAALAAGYPDARLARGDWFDSTGIRWIQHISEFTLSE